MSTVKTLKLTSGEEILCFANEETRVVYVSKPRILQVMHTPSGLGLGLLNFLNSNPDVSDLPIDRSHIIACCAPEPETERAYLEQTSGISLASAGSLITG